MAAKQVIKRPTECEEATYQFANHRFLKDFEICVERFGRGEPDACVGDSGGPLSVKVICIWKLI